MRHRQWSVAYVFLLCSERCRFPVGLQSFQFDFYRPLHSRSLCASAGLFLSALSFVLLACIAVLAGMRSGFIVVIINPDIIGSVGRSASGEKATMSSCYLVRNGRIRFRVSRLPPIPTHRPCYLFRLYCPPESGVICLCSDRRNRK
jgi:multisubunit Na+/H+ antiporter MnhG subunit